MLRAMQNLNTVPQAAQPGLWAGISSEDLSGWMLKIFSFSEPSRTHSFKSGLGEMMDHMPPLPL